MTKLNDLKPDHKNARKRTDRSASLIEESLKKYGAARSIVIDEDGRVLAGNGTIEGAKAAGLEDVRVIESDGKEIIAIKRQIYLKMKKLVLLLQIIEHLTYQIGTHLCCTIYQWNMILSHGLNLKI